MRYGSVCSGIEAATVAWEPLGWQAAWFSDIEPFCCSLLKHYYPNVPNHGDMTKWKEWNLEPGCIDLLVGGTPCQSFSVAGLRKGLADPRGHLMLTYLAIVEAVRPKWLVWENVPGVLSSNGGRDFGTFLGALGQLGYGFAYRVLDAQFFGVPQRRRRVFVVGCLGDWRAAAAVLFERESLSRWPVKPIHQGEVSLCITKNNAGNCNFRGYFIIDTNGRIRRRTPIEEERCFGFPDNYTLIPYKGSLASDGPRYKALGNSMAVPVMHWIGERIDAVSEIISGREAAA